MSADASTTFEFGDGEHTFRLAIGQLRELQDKTGVGPFALLTRVMDGSWRVDDLREIIRIGLIGGGAQPLQALALVKNYVDGRPLMESVGPAKAIMAAALFGDPEDKVGKNQPEETATATGSPSRASTEPAPSSASAPTPSTA